MHALLGVHTIRADWQCHHSSCPPECTAAQASRSCSRGISARNGGQNRTPTSTCASIRCTLTACLQSAVGRWMPGAIQPLIVPEQTTSCQKRRSVGTANNRASLLIRVQFSYFWKRPAPLGLSRCARRECAKAYHCSAAPRVLELNAPHAGEA